MKKTKKGSRKKRSPLSKCCSKREKATKQTHWHHFFISKDIKIVVFDIICSGYRVVFGPRKKGEADVEEPYYGYIEKSGKVIGLISDCKCWPSEIHSCPAGTKTCISALSDRNEFNELICTLYKTETEGCRCELYGGLEKKPKKK